MQTPRASDVAKHRLTLASRRLGTKNPVHAIGGLIDRSFQLPVGDPRYEDNLLVPGAPIPLEHSFSELSSNALNLEMQPLGPEASPDARRQEASREMRRLVKENYGNDALRWYDDRSYGWRESGPRGDSRFGAWFGLGVDPWGLQESKVYYEFRDGDLDALPPNLQHVTRVAMDALPGLVPIFTSIACGRRRGSQRLYFFHRGDLRLLDLEPLLNRLGIGHQLPKLLAAAGVILGGRFTLAEGSVIIGLRDTSKGIELRLDVLLAGMPDPPQQLFHLLNMVLAERPQTQAELRRWVQAMTPDDEAGPGSIGAVSLRISPEMPTRCSLYLRPGGYSQPGRMNGGPGGMTARRDPYHV